MYIFISIVHQCVEGTLGPYTRWCNYNIHFASLDHQVERLSGFNSI
jgi:hypothetical protein